MFYTVTVFFVDRTCGGPEEGGWWYNHGHPVTEIPDGVSPEHFLKAFTNENAAIAWAASLQEMLDNSINKGRRSISSVLSQGRYDAVVCDGHPKAFPEFRPHYE